ASGLKQLSRVVQNDLRLIPDAARDHRIVATVARNQSRQKYRVASLHRIAVRTGRSDPVVRMHDDPLSSTPHCNGAHLDHDTWRGNLADDCRPGGKIFFPER